MPGVEQELKHSKEFVETVLNSMSDAICDIDVDDYRISEVNKKFLEILGMEREDVIGRTCNSITRHRDGPCQPPDDMCPPKEALRGKDAAFEHIHYRKDGSTEHVEVSAHPIVDDDGRIRQVVHITRDITERKEAEEALKGYAHDLEAANRLKDLFTDIMRHDLLNPATAVRGFIALTREPGDEDEREGFLDMAGDNISRVMDMVESAALYSKLDETESLDKSEMDIGQVVKGALEATRHLLEEADIEAVFRAEGRYPAQVNPLMENVFINLISNAAKYALEGKRVEIDISDEGADRVVPVGDRGEGISGDYKEKLLTRYERRYEEGVKGTGPGLAIAKRIVDIHGGRIWVEDRTEESMDEVGSTRRRRQGSVFRVSLPKGGGD